MIPMFIYLFFDRRSSLDEYWAAVDAKGIDSLGLIY